MRIANVAACLATLAAACSFKPGGHGGGSGADANDLGSIIEGSGGSPFGGGIASGIVELGVLEPDVFVPDGLHVRGFKNNNGINTSTDPNDVTSLGSASGELYGMPPDGNWPSNGPGFPFGLFIDQGDTWCIAVDGEMFFDAGPTTVDINVDDLAILWIGSAGSAGSDGSGSGSGSDGIVRIVSQVNNPDGTGVVTLAEAAWLPVVGVMCEDGGDARLIVAEIGSDGSGAVVPASRFRVRTTAVRGADLNVFQNSEEEVGPNPGYDPGPIDHLNLKPLDYSFPQVYSMRYQGQLLVDTAGDHAFTVNVGSDADDRYRLFVDGALVTSTWLGTAAGSAGSGGATLDVGWHTYTLDYAQNVGNAEIHFDLDGAPIAADHLRPTQPQARAFAFAPAACNYAAGSAASVCPFTTTGMSDGAVFDYADLLYDVQSAGGSANLPDAALSLTTPNLAISIAIPAVSNEQELGQSSQYDFLPQVAALAGVTGSDADAFAMSIVDTTAGDHGQFIGEVIATIHGGDGAPYAPLWSYTSAPYHVPAGATVVGAKISGNAALANVTATLEVATAPDDTTIGSAAFQPLPLSGAAIAADALVKYRITLAGDGWSFAVVDRVEVDYTMPAP